MGKQVFVHRIWNTGRASCSFLAYNKYTQVSAFRLGQSWSLMGGRSGPIVGQVADLLVGRHAANSAAERVGQESLVLQECETKMILSWSGVSVMNSLWQVGMGDDKIE